MRRVLRVVWPLTGLAFTGWMYWGFQALPGSHVSLSAAGEARRRAGVIFLPGGWVEPAAYAPLLRPLVDEGYRVEMVELPWRCACTQAQIGELFSRVAAVRAAAPGTAWVLAGHSRGAMLAARYAHERPGELPAALALLGTTHPRDFSLAALAIPVWKVQATRDGIASPAGSAANRHLLPARVRWVEVAGGNHVQYGSYRWQLFDGAATISREEQQAAVRAALREALASVESGKRL